MSEEKIKARRCAKCNKKFTPNAERKVTCETCYRLNSNVSPYAEEPGSIAKRRKTNLPDDSIFKMIHPTPVNTR